MTRASPLRIYVTIKASPGLVALYRDKDLAGLTEFTLTLLRAGQDRKLQESGLEQTSPADPAQFLPSLKVVSAPSMNWRAAFVPPRAATSRGAIIVPRDITPDELVIAYELSSDDEVQSFRTFVNDQRDIPLDEDGTAFLGAGIDPVGSLLDHWCPGSANLAIFGHRRHARQAVRASALSANSYLGQNVNVVIIDEGLDKNLIPANNWGGGLDHYIDTDLVLPAGSASGTSHGMMIARSILDLAPQAKLYDVPVIPPVIESLPVFVSSIQSAYLSLIHEIRYRRKLAPWSGPWVLVNAWGIYDTSADPSGSYTENTEPNGHPMINLLTKIVANYNLDVIFAAGNCGQFCPEQQCGGRDRGPGRSIWGANAHPLVLTAGAVRSDETWVGYSSQGPGPELLSVQKPDLCAPSQFCESYDAAQLSSGTSAACAMAAGIVAALRSNPRWDQASITPQTLKETLTASARKPQAPAGWDGRLGFGILDAEATIAALST